MPAQSALEQLNIRIPKKLARELAALAEAEHVAKIDMARQLLWEGIARRKQDVALKLYAQGQVSKSRAAEIAGLSLWEFTEMVTQRGHAGITALKTPRRNSSGYCLRSKCRRPPGLYKQRSEMPTSA